ncbi:MAG: hypothetical protein BWY82_01746 [Verrucomicrobia bacterium ADurb.Bin474]|nr:MAG: hypothetical protein BWY82_01746 [Verrucomicrobia bacterium ADurb.Bin474]
MEGTDNIGPTSDRFVEKDFAENSQYMFAPFLGVDDLLDAVREEHQSDFVVVECRGERECACELGGVFALGYSTAAECPGGAQVKDQQNRKLTFFTKLLDEGLIRSGRDVPVDRPHIIAVAVFPNFFKVDPASFECAAIGSGKNLMDDASGLDFDRSDFFQHLLSACVHR